ncbi:MAG: hypothetical protein H0A76_11480 [Candidatus Thiodubiliella endoseptemdiera]|uniref:Uncharacterized protein n=1 Tax=Candidatus Thiodubiliella endoseptemdiera TaxID=2738886 RepID=A0A853F381_9GAMM|nr:hypothetical protein [Candidatus Thiodubiliella endoseptemdiera]
MGNVWGFLGVFDDGNDETSSEDGAKDSTIFAISTFGLGVIILAIL